MTDLHYGAHGTHRVWLGIDPGVTTGWAMIEDNGHVLGSGNLVEDELRRGLDTLIRFAHNEGHVITAVVERVPRSGVGRLSQRLGFVNGVVRELVRETYELETHEVMPGEWKPSRVARTTTFYDQPKAGRTAHERDAIRMTLYTMDREKRKAARD